MSKPPGDFWLAVRSDIFCPLVCMIFCTCPSAPAGIDLLAARGHDCMLLIYIMDNKACACCLGVGGFVVGHSPGSKLVCIGGFPRGHGQDFTLHALEQSFNPTVTPLLVRPRLRMRFLNFCAFGNFTAHVGFLWTAFSVGF